ncbi:MAG: class I SAM-dependent methyltransferase [Flavobacteriaceae bacterium]|jgi:ubiquinone/menaquinone biosynthesis C-methylase UbiE|nr:class I SAM-dependent methyltransferase [Flavobacteriaceae bacterium]
METQIEKVKTLFNEMSDEYDNLNDLWYRYSFDIIDNVLIKYFKPKTTNETALDIGCGTGIQSQRLAKLGYNVTGIDISEGLIEKVKQKFEKLNLRGHKFLLHNAETLPFPENSFDVVNCCGPTLPFIENWESTLKEISKCLKPNGLFLLEIEGKWNFDIFWELLSSIFFDCLDYDTSIKKSLSHFKNLNKGHHIDYSFKTESGANISMPIKLFTIREITKSLAKENLTITKRWGIHSLTNIIPSTILHEANPNALTKLIFSITSKIEKGLNNVFPINSFACSLLLLIKNNKNENSRN